MYRCDHVGNTTVGADRCSLPVSSPRLAAVVEKSPSITGSKVAQRLLLEAYRFQAMTSTDAVDVDEHFPGNHRVKVGFVSFCVDLPGLFMYSCSVTSCFHPVSASVHCSPIYTVVLKQSGAPFHFR